MFSFQGRMRNGTVGESKQSDTWDTEGNKKPLTSKYRIFFHNWNAAAVKLKTGPVSIRFRV